MLVCENGDVGSIKLFNVESVFLGVHIPYMRNICWKIAFWKIIRIRDIFMAYECAESNLIIKFCNDFT